MPDMDDGGGFGDWVKDGWDNITSIPRGIADAAGGAVSFATDPFGTVFQKVKDAAQGLSETVLPAVFKATQPDFSLGWFLDAYAVSYGAALFLWVAILMWTIMQATRGVYSSQEVLDVLTTKAGLFFGLSTFGPMAGWTALKFTGALSDSIAAWAVGGTAEEAVDSIGEMIAATDTVGTVGGVVMALGMMAAMLVGLVLVIFMLILTMVTVYLAGAVAPLAFAWFASPSQQQLAVRLLVVLGGLMAAKPLLFFVLGLAYRMAAGSVTWLEGDVDLQGVMNFGAAVIALAVAGLTPFVLFRFAPVSPTTAGQVGPSFHKSGNSQNEPSEGGRSQTQRRSAENADRGDTADAGTSDSGESSSESTTTSTGSGGSGEDSTGAIARALESKKQAAQSGEGGDLVNANDAAGGSEGEPVTAGGGGGSGAEASAGSSGSGAAGSGGGGVPAGGGGGAAAGGASGGGGTAAAAGGAGAVTGGVALAGAAAYIAAKKAAEVSADAGGLAATEMDEGEG